MYKCFIVTNKGPSLLIWWISTKELDVHDWFIMPPPGWLSFNEGIEDLKCPATLISHPVAETTKKNKKTTRKKRWHGWVSQASERLGKPGRPWPLKHSYLVTSFNAFTRDQQTSGRETGKKEKHSKANVLWYKVRPSCRVKTAWRN